MTIINNILLSGWFQLIAFSLIFFIYSKHVLAQRLVRGYMLGCLIGLFFIFTYTSLNTLQSFRLGVFDSELNALQVFMPSIAGIFIGFVMIVMAYLFRNNRIQKSLSTATITAMLFIAICLQAIVQPDSRLMVSLFMLAFGITLLFAKIVMSRRYKRDNPYDAQTDVDYLNQPLAQQQPASRLDSIRQRIKQRITMNNVPTNYPNKPDSG